MKCLFALLQLFLIFQIVLNASLLSSANKALMNSEQAAQITDTLGQNQVLLSPSQNYYLLLQSDGHLLLRSNGSTNGKGQDNLIWSSGQYGRGKGPYSLVLRQDGYLVVNDSTGWSLFTWTKNIFGLPPYTLTLQDSGNLVVTDSKGNTVSQTNTAGKQ